MRESYDLRAAPIHELRFLLRQGRMVFYPPPCGLSYALMFLGEGVGEFFGYLRVDVVELRFGYGF